jgi:hypothetical protein
MRVTPIQLTAVAVVAVVVLRPAAAVGQDEPEQARSQEHLDRRFVLGLAVGLERFDTNIKLTDRETGKPIFLDAEGNFGLPETQVVPILYGGARLSEKHGLGFYAFRGDRTGNQLRVNGDYGDLTIDGNVTLSDRSSFSYINYNYMLFSDQRTRIRALFGVYLVDLRIELTATGNIQLGGTDVRSGVYMEEVRQLAPLPLLGLDFWTDVAGKWYLGAKVGMIGGSYDDLSAFVVEANIRARYQWTDRVAVITGVNYLSADVTIDRSDTIKDIRYGFDGIYLGLDFNF